MADYAAEAQQMYDEDTALDDEELDTPEDTSSSKSKRNINQVGDKGENIDVMPEDSIAPADRAAQGEEVEEDEDGEIPPAAPVELLVTITKPNKGAVKVTAVAEAGVIEFSDFSYFPKAESADQKASDAEQIYTGPPFQHLDSDLQAMLERYLDERGINSRLATFVPDYVDFKEQKEYIKWLESK